MCGLGCKTDGMLCGTYVVGSHCGRILWLSSLVSSVLVGAVLFIVKCTPTITVLFPFYFKLAVESVTPAPFATEVGVIWPAPCLGSITSRRGRLKRRLRSLLCGDSNRRNTADGAFFSVAIFPIHGLSR